MRLAFYHCGTCGARYLGKDNDYNEHCGIDSSSKLFVAHKRCKETSLVTLGLRNDLEREPFCPRGFWSKGTEKNIPLSFWKERKNDPNLPIVHFHRCSQPEDHSGLHICTCDWEWKFTPVAGGAVGWSALDAATQLTSITTQQFFDDQPQADPNEIVDIEIDIDFPVTPTDDGIVAVFGTLDGGTDFDDTARMEFVIDSAVADPNQAGFQTFGIYQFRVGVRRSGTTDTLTNANMNHRQGSMS